MDFWRNLLSISFLRDFLEEPSKEIVDELLEDFQAKFRTIPERILGEMFKAAGIINSENILYKNLCCYLWSNFRTVLEAFPKKCSEAFLEDIFCGILV